MITQFDYNDEESIHRCVAQTETDEYGHSKQIHRCIMWHGHQGRHQAPGMEWSNSSEGSSRICEHLSSRLTEKEKQSVADEITKHIHDAVWGFIGSTEPPAWYFDVDTYGQQRSSEPVGPILAIVERSWYSRMDELYPGALFRQKVSPKRIEKLYIASASCPNMPTKGQHIVYRHWDKRNELLYVGVTSNFKERQNTHRSQAAWWSDITSITATSFESRELAEKEELMAITTENPKHNRNPLGRLGKCD